MNGINLSQKEYLATAALALASCAWGASFLFAKLTFSELAVSHLVLYRFFLASLILVPLALKQRHFPKRKDLPLFAVAAFFTVPATFLLQYTGLSLTSVTSAGLIIGAFPVLMALAATIFLGEKINIKGWAAIAVSTFGVSLIIGSPGENRSLAGDALVFLSLFAAVAWVLLNRRLTNAYPALAVTAYVLALGTLMLLPISLLLDGIPRLDVSATAWASIAALGIVCTCLAYGL